MERQPIKNRIPLPEERRQRERIETMSLLRPGGRHSTITLPTMPAPRWGSHQ